MPDSDSDSDSDSKSASSGRPLFSRCFPDSLAWCVRPYWRADEAPKLERFLGGLLRANDRLAYEVGTYDTDAPYLLVRDAAGETLIALYRETDATYHLYLSVLDDPLIQADLGKTLDTAHRLITILTQHAARKTKTPQKDTAPNDTAPNDTAQTGTSDTPTEKTRGFTPSFVALRFVR